MRYRLLIGPDGAWRDPLWLDSLLTAEDLPVEAESPKPMVLTGPLPINTCGVDSLALLPGVGPVLAARIASARSDGLLFRVPDDLKRVKGIGPVLAGRLAPLVQFAIPDTSANDSASVRKSG